MSDEVVKQPSELKQLTDPTSDQHTPGITDLPKAQSDVLSHVTEK